MHINGVLRVYHPRQAMAVPVLVDSPHSGRLYPLDFNHACPREALQVYEDRFMDLLLSGLPHKGFTVVQAEMPRSYIDLNRAYDDIEDALVPARQLGDFALRPSLNSQRGTGLIWTQAGDAKIYDRLPDADALEARINTYYWPYYAALEREATRIKDRFGAVWHLNMHSMPPTTNNGAFDVVLGDLDGRSCERAFADVIEKGFVKAGLRVVRNKPYKGAQLTKTLGQPDQGRESLQIEISKALYLKPDLITLDRDRFLRMQGVLETVMAEAAIFARSQLPKTDSNADFKAASKSDMGIFKP